jgi:hypothetical protein
VDPLDDIARPGHTITPRVVEFRYERVDRVRMDGRESSTDIAEFIESVVNGRLQSAPSPPRTLRFENSSGLGQVLRSVPIIEERSVRWIGHYGPNDEGGLVTHVDLLSRTWTLFKPTPSILMVRDRQKIPSGGMP